MLERLQKYMAECGVASRRKCEEIILSGRVKVNGTIIKELGYKIDREKDKILIDDKLIKLEERKLYIALNKPVGYLSTVKDERGRSTILDLVKVNERIYPIGRLDYDTSGLILLTNDGEVYNKVIHPRQVVEKTYIAELNGIPLEEEIKRFCTGIDIGGYITAPAKFKILKQGSKICEAEIVIHEGKNRQIRKMCSAINHPVIKLKRISIGAIKIGNLKLGTWRYLTKKEVDYLKNL
ncbi:rRNA pseudouridine synthase [Clostridium sp. SYSU_GA19001]|uniref:pseudouridine synthase n=1 Tax=Clostridium caldaquaticum TaxID=2940653 RepID=UPI002076F646|nr:pseudouridine synthase [Clostridium caldaquaticum]MCM8710668.1 rRNA pseudouridine synthase [Clostridium caldaquaticum]